jgi:hypothetical protein
VWTVGADRANATLTAPGSLSAASPASVGVSWQGLSPGLHLGLIRHSDGDVMLDQTVIEVTP